MWTTQDVNDSVVKRIDDHFQDMNVFYAVGGATVHFAFEFDMVFVILL